MKFSIITPTHNPKFLPDLWDSIQRQSVKDWEWIILANGEDFDLGEHVNLSDPRVKPFWYKHQDKEINVGFLKKKAFGYATGDILVEADHDDILMSNCLMELERAFEDPEIGFVSSNDAKLAENFIPYNPAMGWEYRTIKYAGMKLTEMIQFEADAGALSFIWYSPDHVRAWRKEIYEKVGGHNPDLSICDDHELLIRTYLETKFHHINECLYIYRITGDNTWLERKNAIQVKTKELSKQYTQELAEKDADRAGLVKLDLGGGINPRPGYTTIDIDGGDFTWNLNRGIPAEDNSVGVINASHILEHIVSKHFIMTEIHRVLCDKGWVFIDVPSTDGRGAFMDPTHVSYWNENSFLYYTNKDQARFIHNNTIKFQPFRIETGFPSPWYEKNKAPVTTAWLRAIKGDSRRPHVRNI